MPQMMEVVHFNRIRFEGTWTFTMIDPGQQVFRYDGSGTIRVLRTVANGSLITYVFQSPPTGEHIKVYVIAANCVVHVPLKATLTPGEVFP